MTQTFAVAASPFTDLHLSPLRPRPLGRGVVAARGHLSDLSPVPRTPRQWHRRPAAAQAKLPYLLALGAWSAVWFSPFMSRRRRMPGYDVADYRDIDPLFRHARRLRRASSRDANALEARVIVDLVPNPLSSSEHPWFRAALRPRPDLPERARYLFRDGRASTGFRPTTGEVGLRGQDGRG